MGNPSLMHPAVMERSTGCWFVLHARSRQEKVLAESLLGMDVACYLPLVRAVRYYGERKATVILPLFPGYVFMRGSREQAYDADRTGRVARVIDVADQHRLENEIRNLHIAVCQDAPLDPYPYLQKGIRVEVRSGPFQGMQGLIEDRTKNDRLILQVQALGRATSLEIDGALLEPIDWT